MSGRPKIANGRLGDVAPFRCGTAPGLCVSTCMLVVGGRHRGRTLCIWHPLGVGGLQPLRSAIGAAQSYGDGYRRLIRVGNQVRGVYHVRPA
eukprot:COSAG06_NODE_14290_length_1169_cov_17.604673_1_plen_92_part_00